MCILTRKIDQLFNVIGIMAHSENSYFGVVFSSAIGAANITSKDNFHKHFLTWDNGLKFGYFNRFYAYAKLGLDLFELTFHDDREDDEHNALFVYNDEDNDIDGYIGVGVGYDFKPLKVEFYSRARHIDGNGWSAKARVYTGMQLSFSF